MERNYKVSIFGPFDIADELGESIKPSGAKESAIIAVLALSPNQRRSRKWLRALLWSDRPESQAAASLRQALTRIRKTYAGRPALMYSDDECIWLSRTRVEVVARPPESEIELLEGMDIRDEAFEDWLRVERVKANSDAVILTQRAHSELRLRPIIIIGTPIISSPNDVVRSVSTHICDQVVHGLHSQGLVDVFDLRDMQSNQLKNVDANVSPRPNAVVRISAIELNGSLNIGFQVKEPDSARVLCSFCEELQCNSSDFASSDQLLVLISQAVDAVETAALRESQRDSESLTLFTAVHQLMSHSRAGQQMARSYLERLSSDRRNSVATAWCAFSYAVGLGERYEVGDNDFLEKTQAICSAAIELDPSNAVTRAIVGHVHSFVLRDFEIGAEYLSLARELSPGLPVVWDFSSMHALYTGNAEQSYVFARKAAYLGRLSAMKSYFDTSVVMCASVTGRHDEAIRLGRSVLSKIPELLPVMRHLTGSLAASGDITGARKMIRETKSVDPEFEFERMGDPTYPLISPNSISLVQQAFQLSGMAKH